MNRIRVHAAGLFVIVSIDGNGSLRPGGDRRPTRRYLRAQSRPRDACKAAGARTGGCDRHVLSEGSNRKSAPGGFGFTQLQQ
jgi:hypothetical protein